MSNPQVELHVTINVAETATPGVITLELDAKNAPKSTENFLAYVNKGAYDGTIFHRVIKNFMIQGGGFTPDMKQRDTDAPMSAVGRNDFAVAEARACAISCCARASARSRFASRPIWIASASAMRRD